MNKSVLVCLMAAAAACSPVLTGCGGAESKCVEAYRNSDYQTAFQACTDAVDDHSEKAQEILGSMYYTGKGAPKD